MLVFEKEMSCKNMFVCEREMPPNIHQSQIDFLALLCK